MKVGIDLGTTNSAVAFIDEREAADAPHPPVHKLPILQQISAEAEAPLRTLPSFLYLANPPVVGAYARDQGALLPTRVVHSAKSWLANPEVDRTAKILPWDAQAEGRQFSPVEASASYLRHLSANWEAARGVKLGDQDVALTVPASFDEEARELTLEAAREAGIAAPVLLEEPAAAFYAWISTHLSRSNKVLFDGQLVLVCDVGGGTSDFTLVRVDRTGDQVAFTRTSVGRHLLLGGDNLDLTLSWLAESKLGQQLSLRQRSGLRRQCSAAKEQLLGDGGPARVELTVAGAGSSLIGGSLRTSVTRDEVLELALEGFLPRVALDERPSQEKQSVFRELGLPYVSDPAITRHLAAFLSTAPEARTGIDAILFNGGFFIPRLFRERVRDVITGWYGREPAVFENQDLDLAVAIGAAYYAYVRGTGRGVLVRGGLPRAYYLGLRSEQERPISTVCLVPRGTEEGEEIKLVDTKLELVANRPVALRLYSSLSRTEDRPGDVVSLEPGPDLDDPASDPRRHAPLRAVIRFGKGGERLVPVTLGARLSTLGTLEAWADSAVSEHRWRFEFQLRRSVHAEENAPVAVPMVTSAAVASEAAEAAACSLLEAAFTAGSQEIPPEQLPGRLEQALALGRLSWPLTTIRTLTDTLLRLADGRKKNAAHEARWLNLTGFCLRPGFGYPGDDYRIEQARRVYAAGLVFASQVQCQIEWWIFSGRIAGGLTRNQQADLFQRLSPVLLPRQKKKGPRMNPSLLREMWRTAASLELLPVQTKTQLGDSLLELLQQNEMVETVLWCLSRLGARRLFSGPANLVLPANTAARWIEAILRVKRPSSLEAAVQMAQQTGDASRDVPPGTLAMVRDAVQHSSRAAELLATLSGAESDLHGASRVYGEELPAGLVLATDPLHA